MLGTPFFLCLGIGGIFSAVSGYLGSLNLKQADALSRPASFSTLGAHVGRVVALTGRPRNVYEGSDPERRASIWCRKVHEHWKTDAKDRHGRWVTDRTDEWHQEFELVGDGGPVFVVGRPSEVHGYRTTTDVAPTDGGLFPAQERRVTTQTIDSAAPHVTVCGWLSRLGGEGFKISPCPRLGLLLSTHEAGRQASDESLKGWFGLVGVPLLWIAACVWIYRSAY